MVSILVTTREGEERTIDAREGRSLMEALRAANLGVLGTCGGMCSCGSCHVYAGEDLLAACPSAAEDERDMLDALADVIEVRACSRLSCQILVSERHERTSVEIAPEI